MVLAGDNRQLVSIERGGLFHRDAAAPRRGRDQRGDVAAFDGAEAIAWTQGQEEARKALVAAWTQDTAAQSDARWFVSAYTNRDVDA